MLRGVREASTTSRLHTGMWAGFDIGYGDYAVWRLPVLVFVGQSQPPVGSPSCAQVELVLELFLSHLVSESECRIEAADYRVSVDVFGRPLKKYNAVALVKCVVHVMHWKKVPLGS